MSNNNYHIEPIICFGKFYIRRITYALVDWINQLDNKFYPTIDHILNQNRYNREYNCEYFSIFDEYNYLIIVVNLETVQMIIILKYL